MTVQRLIRYTFAENLIFSLNYFDLSFFFIMLHLIFCILLLVCQVDSCNKGCASCRENSTTGQSFCLACDQGLALTDSGLCIIESTVANCISYDISYNCATCKPGYALIMNMCQPMADGCLFYEKNKCTQCHIGGILNSTNGNCFVGYLNCASINSNGVCSQCQPRYELKNGRCVYNSPSCSFLDKNTGLCTSCSRSSNLIGSICVPNEFLNATKNCYLIDQRVSNFTCKYCKDGYGLYFGICLTYQTIISITNFNNQNCSQMNYFITNKERCLNFSALAKCLSLDYGTLGCSFCSNGYILSNNTCQPDISLYCLSFNPGATSCQVCKQNFYMKNGQCFPFPPFCTVYTNICTRCQLGFQLVNGNCVDPNCQTINPITRFCQICVVNYKLNQNGVCKFMDPNCQQFDDFGDCAQCIKGYNFRSSLQYCVFQDVNCLIFNNLSGGCTMCKPFYYYNKQVQLCIPLPPNCQTADISGRCNKCMDNFNLISNYQCLFIPSIINCQMISRDDYTKCVLCTNGSYADKSGICQQLPQFCVHYDSNNGICIQCNDNGVMKSGVCVDKNCQIFDNQGECLACISSFQFNSFGQCTFQARDPNCKDFMYGICKACVDRYYFSFEFICTAVSPLCRTYDENSGQCTSCYLGYQLNINGQCYIDYFMSRVGSEDILTQSCKRFDTKGQCLQCYPGFIVISLGSTAGSDQVVNCMKGSRPSNSYCLAVNSSNGQCLECVSRMFINKVGKCQSIDQNCNQYDKSTGVCTSCYPGYSYNFNPKSNSSKCIIMKSEDPNCQIKSNNSACSKCYAGFYYSIENLKCTQVNQLCQTYNFTTGLCLSCYSGYSLSNGGCNVQIAAADPIKNMKNNHSPNTFNIMVGCLEQIKGSLQCKNCQWGYALINGSCIQKDGNCQQFLNDNSLICTACYDGYKIFGNDQTRCVLSTLLIDKCLKYSSNVTCLLCQNGYVLTPSLAGGAPYICNIIDQNCANYDTSLNTCVACKQGSTLQGRTCIQPTYGVDPNCIFYRNKLCTACKSGWVLSGFLCSQV